MSLDQKIESFIDKMLNSLSFGLSKHKIGILITVVIHLSLLVAFMFMKIHTRKEYYGSVIEMEFEEPKEEIAIEQPKEVLLPADAINEKYETEAIRNFAVDASEKDLNSDLSDEKNINAEELYGEADRLKQDMQDNKELFEEAQNEEGLIPNTPQKTIPEEKKAQFKGPTVVSYFLEGRKAMSLPVPSYMCELGGQVVVNIEVLPDGRVGNASIDRANSVNDECITDAAINAAMRSRFTSVSNSLSKQRGSITYLFVPQ